MPIIVLFDTVMKAQPSIQNQQRRHRISAFPHAREKTFGRTRFSGLIPRASGYLTDSVCMSDSSKTNEFLRLLMAHQRRIYAFILTMVPNHGDAEDLFQETVLLM